MPYNVPIVREDNNMMTFDKKAIDAKVVESLPFSHRWHNRFHLEMPFGLINDPNGLVYADGTYHIFFQWNPYGCEHKNKCWAHTETKDFIHYKTPELALWPSDDHDKDGCYSGCGTLEEGQVKVLYTCNAKNDGVRTPAQRFGRLAADGSVEKEDIIIPDAPSGITGHFRDPYLFHRGGRHYLVIGAQAEEEPLRGTALIYEETEAGWESLGEIKTRLAIDAPFGYMWECPNLLKFGSHDVLIFCPQGLAARAHDRQNLYQAGYIAGHLSLDAMELLQHTKFQELDRGFDFYAPQVFQHEGRHILLGWMGMPDRDEDYPTKTAEGEGWMFSLTMPRVLTLRQGHIYSQPAKELRALRVEETPVDIDVDSVASAQAPLFDGSEAILDVTLGEAREVTLTVEYGLEKLHFHYDRRSQLMTIDRTGLKNGGKGRRTFPLYAEKHLAFQLFIDRTAVEAFLQHGEEVASLLVFPEKNIRPSLAITSDAPMESISGRIWELDAFRFEA